MYYDRRTTVEHVLTIDKKDVGTPLEVELKDGSKITVVWSGYK